LGPRRPNMFAPIRGSGCSRLVRRWDRFLETLEIVRSTYYRFFAIQS
jgi:hypothetical protein